MFHVLAWLMIFVGAEEFSTFTGGPGPVLAGLHLLTLGVFAMTAMGAGMQLLPVATRRPMAKVWPAKLSYWLFAPGTLVLAWGMWKTDNLALYLGGGSVGTALLIFAILTIDNLRRARSSMPVVAGHGWAAMAALVGLVVLGLVLIADFSSGYLTDRQSITVMHMVLAVFGFMGMLAFGFSHVLIPMFVLSRALPVKTSWLEFCLAVLAVAIATASAGFGGVLGISLALTIGLSASCTYFWLMRSAFKTAMRKRLGLSFIVIKTSWALLVAGLVVGLLVTTGPEIPNGVTLFGFLVLAGWQLTFLLGILQRIMPFLASMHTSGKGGKPALLSELAAEHPLQVHAIFHAIALVCCVIGIVTEWTPAVQAGALAGLVASLAFAAFATQIVLKLRVS